MTSLDETGKGTVVVGVDYSADSTVAFARAVEFARRCGFSVLAVHAIASDQQLIDTTDIWRSGDDSTKREKARLEEQLGGAATAEDLELRVAWGEPARCLARIAEEAGAACLVIGRSGTTGGEADSIGRVARTLLAIAPCPVLVCSRAAAAPSPLRPGMTVADIMHALPATVSQSDTLVEAQRRMQEAGVHQLPVVAAGALIGVVSLVDLERQTGYLDRTKVDAVMTESPIVISPDAPVTEAIGILLDESINALPVLRGDQLVGILSRTDILRLAARLAT